MSGRVPLRSSRNPVVPFVLILLTFDSSNVLSPAASASTATPEIAFVEAPDVTYSALLQLLQPLSHAAVRLYPAGLVASVTFRIRFAESGVAAPRFNVNRTNPLRMK